MKEAGWSGNPTSGDWTQITATTRRGFTFHEHLDNLNLVHMNGRVYDPVVGRFISADPFVPYPTFTQSFNRYSYVENSPLVFTDPSGFSSVTSGRRYCDSGGCVGGSATVTVGSWPGAGSDYLFVTNSRAGTSAGANREQSWRPPEVKSKPRWSSDVPASSSGGGNGFNVSPDQRILLASLARPKNTIEAGISRAILRGDATELRILLSEARGTAAISADDVLIAQRALSAIESIGAQDAALLAGRYGVNFTNTINHAFGQAAHRLGPVIKEFGSAGRAFAEAQRAVDAAYAATGSIPQAIRLGAFEVQVRGAVIDGVAHIRTIFIP